MDRGCPIGDFMDGIGVVGLRDVELGDVAEGVDVRGLRVEGRRGDEEGVAGE